MNSNLKRYSFINYNNTKLMKIFLLILQGNLIFLMKKYIYRLGYNGDIFQTLELKIYIAFLFILFTLI